MRCHCEQNIPEICFAENCSCGRRHARASFLAEHGLAEAAAPDLAVAALPHTRAWLAAASGRLPAFQLALAPAAQLAATAPVQTLPAACWAPVSMRAGRGRPAAVAASAAAAAEPLPAAAFVVPVAPGCWQGVVRLGLVDLVAGEAPVGAGPGLPETLRLDAGRLAAAQHGFQQLLVTAACLLVVRQARADAAQPVCKPPYHTITLGVVQVSLPCTCASRSITHSDAHCLGAAAKQELFAAGSTCDG